MEKIIKEMKNLCKFIGFVGVLQILNLLTSFDEIKKLDISALGSVDYVSLGLSAETLLSIVKVMSVVPMVLGALALFYLCIKGQKEADDPSPAKFHIILSVICAVGYAFAAIGLVAGLFSNTNDLVQKLLEIVICVADVPLLVYYFRYAKQIRTAE